MEQKIFHLNYNSMKFINDNLNLKVLDLQGKQIVDTIAGMMLMLMQII